MKIRCDVCSKHEARVFCCADEAVLCDDCDWRVHSVNKLATRHKRYTLLSSSVCSNKPSQLCDICQVMRALLFCQEDRAILCRDCDLSTHMANEFTQNHNRYLLTGVHISESTSQAATLTHNQTSPLLDSTDVPNSSADTTTNVIHGPEEIPMSSINEYLLETLPGWHLDHFLGPAPPSYCKINDDQDASVASPKCSFKLHLERQKVEHFYML